MPLELGTALSIGREAVADPDIRAQALDAIYLIVLQVQLYIKAQTLPIRTLSQTSSFIVQEGGRRAFWSINGPRILQVGYEEEEHPKVMEAYERVGSLVVTSPFFSFSIIVASFAFITVSIQYYYYYYYAFNKCL